MIKIPKTVNFVSSLVKDLKALVETKDAPISAKEKQDLLKALGDIESAIKGIQDGGEPDFTPFFRFALVLKNINIKYVDDAIKQTGFLSVMVDTLNTAFSSQEFVDLEGEFTKEIVPHIVRGKVADGTLVGTPPGLDKFLGADLPFVKGQVLDVVRKMVVSSFGIDAKKLSGDSYTSFTSSLLTGLLRPVETKISAVMGQAVGMLKPGEIIGQIDDLLGEITKCEGAIRAQIGEEKESTSTLAAVNGLVVRVKQLEEEVLSSIEPQRANLVVISREFKALKSTIAQVKTHKGELTEYVYVNRFFNVIDGKFPEDPGIISTRGSLRGHVETIKGEYQKAQAAKVLVDAAKSKVTKWSKGGLLSIKSSEEKEYDKLNKAYTRAQERFQTTLGELEKYLVKGSKEANEIIASNDEIRSKVYEIRREAKKLVELEGEKQVKMADRELNEICLKQLARIEALKRSTKGLRTGFDKYDNGYFKFIHRLFNTERYQVHQVFDAKAKLESLQQGGGGSDKLLHAEAVLEANERLGNALEQLEKKKEISPQAGKEVGSSIAGMRHRWQAHQELKKKVEKEPVIPDQAEGPRFG